MVVVSRERRQGENMGPHRKSEKDGQGLRIGPMTMESKAVENRNK